MKPFLARPRPYLIAHRGGAGLAPENTLAAFDGAVRLGADALELDVHLSADGEVVVLHDDDTARVTGTPGPVSKRTLAELRALDPGHAFTPDAGRSFPWRGCGLTIPTLSEVLARYPGTLVNVEAKDPVPALAEALASLVRAAGRVHDVCVGSSHDGQAERIRALLPEACHFLPEGAARCHTLEARGGGDGARCPQGWDAADLPYRADDGTPLVDARVLRYFHDRGLAVHVWTVDEEADMRALVAMGIDGIMTDRPDVLRRVLGR